MKVAKLPLTIKLSARLAAAASLVRRGSTVADIGCDHAYLPIWLAEQGIAKRVIASDKNSKPLKIAEANIAASPAGSIITLCRSDGLDGAKLYDPDDIIILGMGGELIVDILKRSGLNFIKTYAESAGIRLILQPMTHCEYVREWLYNNGFATVDELLVEDSGWIYQIICADFAPEALGEPLTKAELALGRLNIARGGEVFARYLNWRIRLLSESVGKREQSGIECGADRELLGEMKSMAKLIN